MDSTTGIGSLEEWSPGLKNVLWPVQSGPLDSHQQGNWLSPGAWSLREQTARFFQREG